MDNKLINLEHEISSYITPDNGATVHFEYETDGLWGTPSWIVSALTINPNNKEIFLLKKESASTKEGALKKILSYVKEQKGLNSFTVIWAKKGNNKTETSYFYCHDVVDVVDKFFNNKETSQYTIYEIKMNPIA